MEFAMKKIMLLRLQEEYADASGHLSPCRGLHCRKAQPWVDEGPWLRSRGKCWERALNVQASPGAGELHRAGRWERGDAVSPIAPSQAAGLPLVTLIFSKAPWPQHWALAPVLRPLHLHLSWYPRLLCCSCSSKQVAAPGRVNIFMRFLSVCCYWPVLGQARGAMRWLCATWRDRDLLYPGC